MLTLPVFAWLRPHSLPEALAMFGEAPEASLWIAGGTDAVPNLKHRLHEPKRVISLAGVRELHYVREDAEGMHLGALITLRELSEHARVRAGYPALAKAASLVASPQIRNMGTLGGNLCLDTRCTYYNQTFFWREALGFCLKKDGTKCHVVPQGKRCVAAHSSDVAPVLIALGAEVEIATPPGLAGGTAGLRRIAVDAFFVGDGVHNNVLQTGELVTRIIIPAASQGLRAGYQKLRPRGAIDFPMLSVAAAGRTHDGAFTQLRIVVSALGAKPRVLGQLDALALGRLADEAAFAAIAQAAYKQCHPLTNIAYDHEWRHEMVPVFVKRVLRDAFVSA